MRLLNRLQWAGALVLAFSLSPGRVVAQDTITITGTFKFTELSGTVGADLAGIQPNAADRWWKLTLNGVTYSHDYFFYTFGGWYVEKRYTYAHPASFTFEFFGPDAAVLNAVVSSQLEGGAFAGGAVLSLMNVKQYEIGFEGDGVPGSGWDLWLSPMDPSTGVSFAAYQEWSSANSPFAADVNGYPLVRSRRLAPDESDMMDDRDGNSGWLISYPDIVDIVVDQQTVPPPGPLPPPVLAIQNASVAEGNKGATTLLMTVTLDRASATSVTLNYHTVNGTAIAGKDYVATAGKLTFQPGETSKAIPVPITGDRQREPNETFTVQLSNAVGANLSRSVGTATIVNDD